MITVEVLIGYLALFVVGIFVVRYFIKKYSIKSTSPTEHLKEEIKQTQVCLDNEMEEISEKSRKLLEEKRKLSQLVGGDSRH